MCKFVWRVLLPHLLARLKLPTCVWGGVAVKASGVGLEYSLLHLLTVMIEAHLILRLFVWLFCCVEFFRLCVCRPACVRIRFMCPVVFARRVFM
jgi:hypothetical protein